MIRLLAAVILGLILTLWSSASPLQRDLGLGLVYIRVAHAPDDLPRHSQAPSIVLDLRFATGTSIQNWLETYAAPRTPIFVLANSQTEETLRHSIFGIPGVIVIGAASSDFSPDIPISVSTEDDLLAYEAIRETADLDQLIDSTPSKVRYDEAAMVKAQHEGKAEQPEEESAEPEEPAIIDPVLQRAVHIHRGWLVLRHR